MTKRGKTATEIKSVISGAIPCASQPPVIWSPPLSPGVDDRVVVSTDDRGMIIHDESSQAGRKRKREVNIQVKREDGRSRRPKVQYVSRHFQSKRQDEGVNTNDRRIRKKRKTHVETNMDKEEQEQATISQASTPPSTNILDDAPTTRHPRIFFGLNLDELSSDSDLSDPPSDFENWPDPFTAASKSIHKKDKTKKSSKRKQGLTKSPYFPHAHKVRPQFLSTLPFPPLHLPHFGLMQEKLAHDPFRLLLATIFLNKTPGQRAMPIFYDLMARYSTPEALADAKQSDVTAIIQCLGFQNQRAAKCIAMARVWCEKPPERGKRYRKLHYPCKGDGRDIKEDEVLGDEDDEDKAEQLAENDDVRDDNEAPSKNKNKRVAWEISHLPGIGAYGHDSWRMFCRDQLRGLSSGWNGETACKLEQNRNHKTQRPSTAAAATSTPFEPEWKRVLPLDKELRAWMTWMWMKEGWVWNKETGQRHRAPDDLMALARGEGNIVLESGKNILEVKALEHDAHAWMPKIKNGDEVKEDVLEVPVESVGVVSVQAPAGEFVPDI